MTDQYANAKAAIGKQIESAKKSANPLAKLKRLEQIMIDNWRPMFADMKSGLAAVNDGREQAGIEREPVTADALEFPNWCVAEVRKAIDEVQA